MARRRWCKLGIVIALLAVGADAVAQTRDAPRKSTATGRWIALAATMAPLAVGVPLVIDGESTNRSGPSTAGGILVMLGVLVGPGMGHAYAGNADRAGDGILALAVGGAALVAHAVFDIVGVEGSVEEFNARPVAATVSVVPYVDRQDRAVGLQVAVGW